MMNSIKRLTTQLFIILVFVLGSTSCDDVVQLDTGTSDPVLNIDAWVNDKEETQTIYLTTTQNYFDNSNLPPAVKDAVVIITDSNGNTFGFEEDLTTNDGAYRWTPAGGNKLIEAGLTYELNVAVNGHKFTSTCNAGRIPKVDSISFSLANSRGKSNQEDMYRAEFWAKDLPGAGDTYWIKAYKNGMLLNKAEEINIAYDAGEDAGSTFDGETFILPVRTGINASDEDADGDRISSVSHGDTIYVEIHSISGAGFNYLTELITQTGRNNGSAAIFLSTPLDNLSTNIVDENPDKLPVVGFFNVSVVSGLGKKFQ